MRMVPLNIYKNCPTKYRNTCFTEKLLTAGKREKEVTLNLGKGQVARLKVPGNGGVGGAGGKCQENIPFC